MAHEGGTTECYCDRKGAKADTDWVCLIQMSTSRHASKVARRKTKSLGSSVGGSKGTQQHVETIQASSSAKAARHSHPGNTLHLTPGDPRYEKGIRRP
jgi:hypothetical protein